MPNMTIPAKRKGAASKRRRRLPSVSEDDDFILLTDDSDSDEEETLAEFIRSTRQRLRRVSSPKSVTLPNPDVLDCPTCCKPLKKPIFQCHKGHVACLSCCNKLKKRCSICSLPNGDIRCRAMEKVIKTSSVLCRNAKYGCKQTLTYGQHESSHEKLCAFAPCSCPMRNCNYIGSYKDLKDHFSTRHDRNKDYFIPFVFDRPEIFGLHLSDDQITIFQEEKEGDLIVVQGFTGSHGVYVTVSLIAPMVPKVRNLSCSLANLKEKSTLTHQFLVKEIQKVSEQEQPEDGFMLIPSYMVSGDNLKMQIRIVR